MEDDDLVTGKKRKRSLSQGGDEEEVHEFAMTVPEVTPETSDADVSRLFNRMVWGTKMHPQLERDLQDAMKSAQRKKRRVRGGSEEASEDGSGAHGQTADDVMREIGMLEDNAPPAPGSVHSDDVDVFAASEAEEAKGDDEMSVDSHIDVQAKRKARNFFDDTTHDDAEERAAFANIEAAQQHNVRNLQAVIPPADLKRLYLRYVVLKVFSANMVSNTDKRTTASVRQTSPSATSCSCKTLGGTRTQCVRSFSMSRVTGRCFSVWGRSCRTVCSRTMHGRWSLWRRC